MSRLSREVQTARDRRDVARALFDQRAATVKGDLAAKGIGARIAEDISGKASAGLAEAKDIASSHRGIIAGTIVALVLWFLRRPLIALAVAQYAKWEDYRRDA